VRQMEVADDSTLHCTHGDGEGRECGEEEVEVMKSKTRQHDRLASRPKVRPRVEMVTATVWLWLGAPLRSSVSSKQSQMQIQVSAR
jgi:hypothetical protein